MKRIIFLFALLFSMSFSSYGQNNSFCTVMKITGPNIILLSVFIIMISTCTWAQDINPPQPQANSGPGGPPPPGLVVPIDNHLSLLIAAGLSLGIYFFASAGKKTPESK